MANNFRQDARTTNERQVSPQKAQAETDYWESWFNTYNSLIAQLKEKRIAQVGAS